MSQKIDKLVKKYLKRYDKILKKNRKVITKLDNKIFYEVIELKMTVNERERLLEALSVEVNILLTSRR